jgi:hypothetical protein
MRSGASGEKRLCDIGRRRYTAAAITVDRA